MAMVTLANPLAAAVIGLGLLGTVAYIVHLTQPVFEIESLERALDHFGDLDLKILLGLMPLRTARQAEFMQREVPGINVPKHVRDRIAELPKEDVPKYGVELAQEILAKARPLINGAYIMPPASAPELAGDVLEAVEGAGSREH